MDALGLTHLVSSLVALVLGTAVVLGRKGTRRHVWLGRGYLLSMGVLIATALPIQRLYGGWGPFHWMALAQTGVVIAGGIPLLRRRADPHWRIRHAFYMTWSYVGLVAAAAAETTARIPGAPFAETVIGTVVAVVLAGRVLLERHLGVGWRPVR